MVITFYFGQHKVQYQDVSKVLKIVWSDFYGCVPTF